MSCDNRADRQCTADDRFELFADPSRPARPAGAGLAAAAALPAAARQDRAPAEHMPTSSRELWQWVRTQPVLDPQHHYLDVASVGPTLRAAMAAEYRARESQSLTRRAAAERWTAESTRLATRFAAFLGCDADEVAVHARCRRGAGPPSSPASILSAGDEVLTTTREHPAALSPWLILARRRGIVVKQIELPAPLTGPEQASGCSPAPSPSAPRCSPSPTFNTPTARCCRSRAVPVRAPAQYHDASSMARRRSACSISRCATWAATSMRRAFTMARRQSWHRHAVCAPRDARSALARRAARHRRLAAGVHADDVGRQRTCRRPCTGSATSCRSPGRRCAASKRRSSFTSRSAAQDRSSHSRARDLCAAAAAAAAGVELLTPARPGLWGGILTFRVPGKHGARPRAGSSERSSCVSRATMRWPSETEGAVRASLHVFNTHDESTSSFRACSRRSNMELTYLLLMGALADWWACCAFRRVFRANGRAAGAVGPAAAD